MSDDMTAPRRGSLLVVGIGISLAAHATVEALGAIREADEVHFVVPSSAEEWLRSLNPRARSLGDCYQPGKPRKQAYADMADRIMQSVRDGRRVCGVFYGHPGVFVDPSHRAIAQARAEGFAAQMLPGVSAEDCLFADLGLDPAIDGCHSYEATDFVIRKRQCDPSALLVLWQVGALGESSVAEMRTSARMQVLADVLSTRYPCDHEVILYEASRYPICNPYVERLPLHQLGTVVPPSMATLVVPPATRAVADAAEVARLKIDPPIESP